MTEVQKKVGIVTMVGSDNYGNALQNYAVQTLLEQAGYQAYTLLDRTQQGFPFSAQKKEPFWKKVTLRYISTYFRVKAYGRNGSKNDRDFTWDGRRFANSHIEAYRQAKELRHQKFEDFRKETLHFDEAYIDNTRFDRENYNSYYAFVCGSDQVWGPHYRTTSMVSFLQFAPPHKRIALAPSFGASSIPENRRRDFTDWIKGIPHLSVREEAGARIIKELTGREAKVLLDPSFALSSEQWHEFSRKPDSVPSKEYVFCYFLGNMSHRYRHWIEEYAEKNNYDIVDICDIQDLEHFAIGPREFVWLLDHAKAVFTDSFHGIAFSINLQRPFVAFERVEGGTSMSSRIATVLKKTGLEARRFPLSSQELVEKCDFKNATLIIGDERDVTKNYLEDALESVGKGRSPLLASRYQCTGCGACYNACAVGALTLQEDIEGFKYPVINTSKCINCGRCEQACPANAKLQEHSSEEFDYPLAYWAFSKDDETCRNSSSGGVFTAFAEKIIKASGVVFGVGYDENFKVIHRKITSLTEIPLLRTSKYVQSDTGSVYKDVREELASGRKVLFTGTPCQVAALKSYLGRDYDNLWTQDIICHGVPSPGVWRRYLEEEHRNKGNEPVSISFRDKTHGWNNFAMKILYQNGGSYCVPAVKDPFERAFLANLILRPSCYQCQFKTLKRISDITLADYWGVETVHKELANQQGVSLILVQSKKGQELFGEIKGDMNWGMTNRERAVAMNHGTLHSALWHPKRNSFFRDIEKLFLKKDIENCLRESLKRRMRKLVIRVGAKVKKCLIEMSSGINCK